MRTQQTEVFLAWLEGAVAGVSLACARQSDHRGEQWQGRMLPVLAAVSSAGRQRDLSHTRPGLKMASLGGGSFQSLLEAKLHLITGSLSTVLRQLYRGFRQHLAICDMLGLLRSWHHLLVGLGAETWCTQQ